MGSFQIFYEPLDVRRVLLRTAWIERVYSRSCAGARSHRPFDRPNSRRSHPNEQGSNLRIGLRKPTHLRLKGSPERYQSIRHDGMYPLYDVIYWRRVIIVWLWYRIEDSADEVDG